MENWWIGLSNNWERDQFPYLWHRGQPWNQSHSIWTPSIIITKWYGEIDFNCLIQSWLLGPIDNSNLLIVNLNLWESWSEPAVNCIDSYSWLGRSNSELFLHLRHVKRYYYRGHLQTTINRVVSAGQPVEQLFSAEWGAHEATTSNNLNPATKDQALSLPHHHHHQQRAGRDHNPRWTMHRNVLLR